MKFCLDCFKELLLVVATALLGTIVVWALPSSAFGQDVEIPVREATKQDLIGTWDRIAHANVMKKQDQTSVNQAVKRRVFWEDNTTKEWQIRSTGNVRSDLEALDKRFPGLTNITARKAQYKVRNGDIWITQDGKSYMLGSLYISENPSDPKFKKPMQFPFGGQEKKGDLVLINPITGDFDLMRKVKSTESK